MHVLHIFALFTFMIFNNLALMIFSLAESFEHQKFHFGLQICAVFYAFEKRAILEAMVHHLRNGYTKGLT